MLRIRKLVLAIAAASALSSGMAHALGLGELTLKSAQNQPLDAEIELLDVRDLTAAEMAPSLAPPEEFAKAGIERPTYLNDLIFTPVINPNGKSVLRVTSSQALPAPMVKFLVQVMWPSGRLLRDYSVLVNQAALPGAKPESAISPAVSAPGNYTTVRRDTLWEIASKARQGGSVQQTMLAIQALNPDAFINGNINLLKTGQVLRLPDQQQVMSIPQGQAVAEVAEQYAAWREGRRLGPRARQLDATRRTAAEAAPARIANQDNLRLVAPGSKAAASDGKAVSDKLALAQESLDTSRRDNTELKSRMSDLQSQLDKLERLIALKNDQLARLEAQGAAGQEPATGTPAQPAIAAQLQSASGEPVVAPAPAAVDTAPLDASTPATEEAAPSSTLDDVLGNPTMLALIGASALLVLLLLLLLLARKRKADQEAEKHLRMARALAEESERNPDLDLPPSSFEGLEVPAPSVTLAPAVVAASAAAASAAEASGVASSAAAAKPVEAPVQPQPMAAPLVAPAAEAAPAPVPSGDALLDEVELSIARGRLNHAADLLEPAVAAAPGRSDLRLKLMEVYARQGDRDAFVGHERQLIANGQNHADVEALKSRFPAMVALAAAGGIGAAALAAQMDAQYVQALLQDEPQAQPEPVIEPEPEAIVDQELDSAFDLSLEDDLQGLELTEPLQLGESAPEIEVDVAPEPVIEPVVIEPAFDEPLVEPAPVTLDDLADFDLDVAADPIAALPQSEPVDIAAELAAFDETMPEFDSLSELDLPEDFDLSLSLDDDSAAAKSFASELDDVNAELDKLSQSLEQPSIEPHFTAEDAMSDDLGDDLEFDYLGGADEAATKLDLARAYIDMGDHDGARDILDEVRKEGNDAQKGEAEEMLSRLV
ncbi:FimV/HubP family polar landmark protein [Pseudomonas auratipiscis]|uniref:FimV/HubP family polar landmark protein n=1 Tax=Pseudomonas auratipiscis TaxID=3115853 RepID=A0AB35X342_9PSED|nr:MULTISPECIES: FimV/HubP family polar landmark protein [unclassified Pseudomonas]MEE1869937.1 FimV/HubP family polar landmark protein [Pseudomonas sp. 120P]MEE1960993.1 FimV/HubP family polar landmark protein [Pseudomonas sp. 119P]